MWNEYNLERFSFCSLNLTSAKEKKRAIKELLKEISYYYNLIRVTSVQSATSTGWMNVLDARFWLDLLSRSAEKALATIMAVWGCCFFSWRSDIKQPRREDLFVPKEEGRLQWQNEKANQQELLQILVRDGTSSELIKYSEGGRFEMDRDCYENNCTRHSFYPINTHHVRRKYNSWIICRRLVLKMILRTGNYLSKSKYRRKSHSPKFSSGRVLI